MLNKFTTGTLSAAAHWKLFKALFIISNVVSLIIFAIFHLIFFDFPFEVMNEITGLVKLLAVSGSIALAVSMLILIADSIEYLLKKRKTITVPAHIKIVVASLVVAIVILGACNIPVSVGVKKDFNTGLSSSYSAMEPENVMLVMNNEVLNHTDIPLGESFLIVNDGVKGLQPKNGKVRVGCSLTLSDQKGNVLLNEKDLFEGHDEFDEKDAKLLKCTVNTGEPMKWEEKYTVAVTFWDKNGAGKIENKVTIRSIDIP